MPRSLTLFLVTCLALPGIGSAQIVIDSVPLPAPPPPPLRLFRDTVPEPGGQPMQSKSDSWWEPPVNNSDVPRFTIGHTVSARTPAGIAVSAGFFGRRADPLPLFLSQGVSRDMQRLASTSVRDPATHRLQFDAKLGVTVPLWRRPQFKVDGLGEAYLPLAGEPDPSAAFAKSPGFRLGVVTAF